MRKFLECNETYLARQIFRYHILFQYVFAFHSNTQKNISEYEPEMYTQWKISYYESMKWVLLLLIWKIAVKIQFSIIFYLHLNSNASKYFFYLEYLNRVYESKYIVYEFNVNAEIYASLCWIWFENISMQLIGNNFLKENEKCLRKSYNFLCVVNVMEFWH